jgi:hypothetical protein
MIMHISALFTVLAIDNAVALPAVLEGSGGLLDDEGGALMSRDVGTYSKDSILRYKLLDS